MNPQEQAKYQASVMIAFSEGKTIQGISHSTSDRPWIDYAKPDWNWKFFNYRVKPADPKKVKLSAYITDNGQLLHYDMLKVKTWNGSWTRVPSLDLEYEVES